MCVSSCMACADLINKSINKRPARSTHNLPIKQHASLQTQTLIKPSFRAENEIGSIDATLTTTTFTPRQEGKRISHFVHEEEKAVIIESVREMWRDEEGREEEG